MKRWRVGYAAFWLIILFVPFEISQTVDWLFGKHGLLGHHNLIGILVIVVLSFPLFVLIVKFRPRFEAFLHYLNTCQLPRFTVARAIVGVGLVMGFCFCFLWQFVSVEELYDPRWLLLVSGLIISFNFLETHWVATDQRRQRSEPHPNRKSFA